MPTLTAQNTEIATGSVEINVSIWSWQLLSGTADSDTLVAKSCTPVSARR